MRDEPSQMNGGKDKETHPLLSRFPERRIQASPEASKAVEALLGGSMIDGLCDLKPEVWAHVSSNLTIRPINLR